ncbi:MAG TPA: hypothetical protein VF062_05755 [Candidatus Limnocylindrales bacterium]
MYITSATLNDTQVSDETYPAGQLSTGLIEALIRRLDGARHTMVTLSAGEQALMTIGGKAGEGFVVYQNSDASYHVLSATDAVSLAAGDVRQRDRLVDLDRAVTAANEFALHGRLADGLVWQTL